MDKLINADCINLMQNQLEIVDLVVTSPPYDNLREYNGFEFDAGLVLRGIHRVLKDGGVCCWVVADQTINGERSGSSFQHALFAKEIGFRLYDVIIWQKPNTPFTHQGRYTNCFEYIFVFSKGRPATFNPIRVPKQEIRKGNQKFARNSTGKGYTNFVSKPASQAADKVMTNVWTIPVGFGHTMKGSTDHPAMFPERLAEMCIRSWSNEGDLVMDPMCGSGTTCVVAKQLGRSYLGVDISAEYLEIARERLDKTLV